MEAHNLVFRLMKKQATLSAAGKEWESEVMAGYPSKYCKTVVRCCPDLHTRMLPLLMSKADDKDTNTVQEQGDGQAGSPWRLACCTRWVPIEL